MQTSRFVVLAYLIFGAIAHSPISHAQANFPTKPVKIIVPFGAGGAADLLPRLVGAKLSETWGQPVVVENRPGAGGNIGMLAGAKAPNDGYTLTSAPVGSLAINPHIYSGLAYNVLQDFTPITLLGVVRNVLVVGSAVQAASVPELIAAAKAKPGEFTFGSGGVGSQSHLAGEMFRAAVGINMTHVAYKGPADAVNDLLGGRLTMMFAQFQSVQSHIQSGKLRMLATASAKRIALYPNVPTIAEAANLRGFEADSWYSLVGPAGMAPDIVRKLQIDTQKALQSPEVRDKLAGMNIEPVGSTPEQLTATFRADYDRYGTIVKKLGVTAD